MGSRQGVSILLCATLFERSIALDCVVSPPCASQTVRSTSIMVSERRNDANRYIEVHEIVLFLVCQCRARRRRVARVRGNHKILCIAYTWSMCAAHIVLWPFSSTQHENEMVRFSSLSLNFIFCGLERPVRCIMSIIIYTTNTIYYYYFCTHFVVHHSYARKTLATYNASYTLFVSVTITHAHIGAHTDTQWVVVLARPDKYKMTNNEKFPQAKIAINSLQTHSTVRFRLSANDPPI